MPATGPTDAKLPRPPNQSTRLGRLEKRRASEFGNQSRESPRLATQCLGLRNAGQATAGPATLR